MNKKAKIISGIILTTSLFWSLALPFFSLNSNHDFLKVKGKDEKDYSFIFNNVTNKVGTGNGLAYVKTNNNNTIAFEYDGLTSSEGWQKINQGGYFANQNEINGLDNITVIYTSTNSKKLKISYGWDEMVFQEEISSGQTYYFNSQYPPYFRIDNLTGNIVDINSIAIHYSCESNPKPIINDGFVCYINNYQYLIDVKSLSVSNIESAYNYALNLEENQLFDVEQIVINLPSGKSYLDNTITFEGERKNYTPIRIKGNNTIFYGGHELSKGIWTPYKNGIYRASIGQNLNKFSSLTVNDEVKTLAKTDNYSFAYSFVNRKITINKSTLDLDAFSGTCELVTLENWAQNIGVVSSISSSGNPSVIHTLNLDKNGQTIFYEREPSYRPNSTTTINGYLQDNLLFLDEVNEWYYDQNEGYLYYMPSDASTINSDSFVISSLETILDTGGLVDNVTFDNLQFNGSNFSTPLLHGFAETQTSWYYDPEMDLNTMITGMVHIYSVNTVFTNCTFNNASNASINIDGRSINTSISNSQILNSGAEGIIVGRPNKMLEGDIPEDITIDNNFIDVYGRLYLGGPGICAFYADKLTIDGNNISNGAYSGIAVGWGWLYDQSGYGHSRYRILNNRISNVMNNAFHDGGGIYTLGSFPNVLSETYNEISGNYVEINNQVNGGIYLDEGSSSWDVHDNIINIVNGGSTYHGVIMMHDPIDVLSGTYNSQFANHIYDNYYLGDLDGSENQMQLTYDNSSGVYYSGSNLSNYNNSRNIVFDTPILGSGPYVNNAIYNLSGLSDKKLYSFANEDRFSKMISGYSNLNLDSVCGSATFNVTTSGFIINNNYLRNLVKEGYYSLSFKVAATSLNNVEACYAIAVSGGTISWQVFYSQTSLTNSITIPLNTFNVEGAICKIQIRDVNGLSQDNNLPAAVTISNLNLSKFPPLIATPYDSVELVSSSENEFVYQANNISYDWKRILFNDMDLAIKKGYPRAEITISGNNHNLYVFKTDGNEIDYNNQIAAGGGSVIIDLEDSSRQIAIMTSHENYNVPGGQDDTGVYGVTENLRITFKFISPSFEDLLFSKKTISKYFSGLVVHDVNYDSATISFINSKMRLSHNLIESLVKNEVSSIEFDIIVPNDSNVKSIVTCWFGGPNNTDVTYSNEGVFRIDNNGVIHVTYYANRFNNAYDIELVSRDINEYSGNDINLVNATITNFVFNY